MAFDIQEGVPAKIKAGETLKWRLSSFTSEAPASLWTLTYALRGPSNDIDITATAETDETFLVNVAAVTTTGYTAGDYFWQAKVTDGTDEVIIGNGKVTIEKILEDETGAVDRRTHAKKTLDALEAVIENKATLDQRTVKLGGTVPVELQLMSPEELYNWRDKYKREVAAEEAAENIKNNRTNITTMKFRFK